MDKDTISQYGWIIITIVVMSIMLNLASPIGAYINNTVTVIDSTPLNAENYKIKDKSGNPTITFETNGGKCNIDNLVINKETLYELPIPQKDGYSFDGWYYNNEKIENIDTNSIDKDVIYLAHWIPIS